MKLDREEIIKAVVKAVKDDYSHMDKVGMSHTPAEKRRFNRKNFHVITIKHRRIEVYHKGRNIE